MITYKEKVAEAKSLFDQAKAVLEKGKEATQEELNQVPALIADAKKLQGQALDLKTIAEAGKALAEATEEEAEVAEAVVVKETKARKVGASGFKSWGEFLYSTWEAAAHRGVDPRLTRFEDDEPQGAKTKSRKDLAEATGAGGGFLVPVEFRPELMMVVADSAIVRPRATVIPMRRRQIQMPALDQSGTAAGVPHWYGGMQFTWVEEGAEKPDTDPVFRQITLTAHKLVGITRSTDELLDDDGVGLAAFLEGPMGMAGGVAWMEDFAFYQGDGIGKPLGFLNAASIDPLGPTLKVTRKNTGEINFEDVVGMLESFLPSGKGTWLASQSILSELLSISGPSGNPALLWLPAPFNAQGPIPGALFGYPVIFGEKSPVLGSTGDLALVDLNHYLIGDRQSTTIEATKFEKWAFDKTSWRVVHRVDGQPWLNTPLTLQDGSTKVSPFVVLDTSS